MRYFTEPALGDIVWCLFPQSMGVPGPKPRPALVIAKNPNGGKPLVTVVYGTSQKLDKIYPTEFTIQPGDGAAFTISGLSYPTKFDLAQQVVLPYCDSWFAIPPHAPCGNIPKLGLLGAILMPRVMAAKRNLR